MDQIQLQTKKGDGGAQERIPGTFVLQLQPGEEQLAAKSALTQVLEKAMREASGMRPPWAAAGGVPVEQKVVAATGSIGGGRGASEVDSGSTMECLLDTFQIILLLSTMSMFAV